MPEEYYYINGSSKKTTTTGNSKIVSIEFGNVYIGESQFEFWESRLLK